MCSIGGGEKSRLYLDARVSYVTPGSFINRKRVPPVRVPMLILEYSLEALGPVTVILGEMRQRAEVPEVYIWDEEVPFPEVAVFFKTRQPGKKTLDLISGKAGETINQALIEGGCEHALTVAEVNLTKSDIHNFLREYRVCKNRMILEIREVGQPYEIDPVHRFIGSFLKRKRPELEI